ncbi:hypothetical protein ACIQGZ_17145 [Streptomyces sp. NPDC092296]|uniref:hypothetical protein n=1 Tax=Streptomyces sp. NPDC092296 TaxID=3366012 RepID=UPI0038234996
MTIDPSAYEAEAVFEEGRGLPYTQLGDWVNHAGITDRAARIYWTLCEHLNIKRSDREVWPAQNVLAKVLGIKRAADVAPAIDELVVIGAVEIRADYDASGRRVRNRYIIHRAPEDGYVGPRSLAEFYKLLRVDDGRRYDSWFAARRKEIADGIERLKRERQEADRRAKDEVKRRALGGAGSRTSASPAKTRKTAGRQEVRDSARGGAGFRTAEVRDSALEQDVVEQHEALSLRMPQPAAPEPPAAPSSERETPAPHDKPTAAQRAVRASRAVAPDEESDFIAWVTATCQPRTPGWWRTAAPDLPEHADAWRAQQAPTTSRQPTATLPPWCGRCDDSNPAAEHNPRFRIRNGAPCPACHPDAIAAAA